MADSVTSETLRELASFRSEGGRAFSLYLDLDPSTTPTAADAETHFRSLVDRAERELENGDKAAAQPDLERIQGWWQNEFERNGARGIAFFASAADDLWRVFPLYGTVRDDVHVGRGLRLTPLLDLDGDGEGSFVAVVGRERGQVFRLHAGRLEEIVDRSEEQPGQHSQGGWSQARFQRHIDKLVAEHLKTIGGEIDKRLRRVDAPRLVIVAPDELRGEIEDALSQETRDAIVGWIAADAYASPDELLELARPQLDHAHAARMSETLERWRAERGGENGAAEGWNETLAAASDGRVELLLLGDGDDREAYECPECGRGEVSPGSCPLDGAKLEPVDASEIAVRNVFAHGGSVAHVAASELGDAEVGALLRF